MYISLFFSFISFIFGLPCLFSVHFQTISAHYPPEQSSWEEPKAAPRDVIAQPFHAETIHVMFPYQPPHIGDNVNNKDMNNDDCGSPTEDKTFIEMTVIPRHYTGLETHYAETPLSHVNPEDPPPNTYEATRITEGWEMGSKKSHPTEWAEQVSVPDDAGASGADGPSHTDYVSECHERPPSPRAEGGPRRPAPRAPSPTEHVTHISISTSTTYEKDDESVSAAFI